MPAVLENLAPFCQCCKNLLYRYDQVAVSLCDNGSKAATSASEKESTQVRLFIITIAQNLWSTTTVPYTAHWSSRRCGRVRSTQWGSRGNGPITSPESRLRLEQQMDALNSQPLWPEQSSLIPGPVSLPFSLFWVRPWVSTQLDIPGARAHVGFGLDLFGGPKSPRVLKFALKKCKEPLERDIQLWSLGHAV